MKYKVMLGKHRGSGYICTSIRGDDVEGYLPPDMLPDGTIVTIERVSLTGWLYLKECNKWVYPPSLLIPVSKTKTARLLKHVRSLDEA